MKSVAYSTASLVVPPGERRVQSVLRLVANSEKGNGHSGGVGEPLIHVGGANNVSRPVLHQPADCKVFPGKSLRAAQTSP